MISRFSQTFLKRVGPFKGLPRYPQWTLTNYVTKSFATVTADIKSVPGNKPPTLEESPHGRYASVLFASASSKEVLHTVLEDVRFLKELVTTSSEFRDFLENASFRRAEQLTVLLSLVEKAEFNPLTVEFLKTVVENKRLDSLPKVLDKYIEYYRVLNKEENITIISAFDLNEDDKKRVQDALKQSQKGVNFTLKYKVDPAILGGLQMYSGNTFMDASLASRVAKVKSELSRLSI